MHKRLIATSFACLVQPTLFASVSAPASAAPVVLNCTGGFPTYTVATSRLHQIMAWGAQVAQ